jgi:hypothetical protein
MAFTPIDSNKIKVGDPVTKELWDQLKANLDDHELRIQSLSTTGGTVFIFNGDVSFINYDSNNSDIFYYKARQDFSVNDFRTQLFTKSGLSTGTLTLRLEKSVDTNNVNFVNILNTDVSFDFAVDANYSEKIAVINTALNDILTGEVLRVRVISKPAGFTEKILMSIGAQ